MLKAVGALLVILSCGAMGYGKSLSYTKRQRELEEIQKMLYFLLGEITYRREALPEAMVRVADKIRPPLSDFLREVSRAAKEYQGERFSKIFSQKAEKYLKETSLMKTDLEEFTMQENTINLYLEELKGEILKTEKEGPARKKMYQALGLMAGMFLAIMLV